MVCAAINTWLKTYLLWHSFMRNSHVNSHWKIAPFNLICQPHFRAQDLNFIWVAYSFNSGFSTFFWFPIFLRKHMESSTSGACTNNFTFIQVNVSFIQSNAEWSMFSYKHIQNTKYSAVRANIKLFVRFYNWNFKQTPHEFFDW